MGNTTKNSKPFENTSINVFDKSSNKSKEPIGKQNLYSSEQNNRIDFSKDFYVEIDENDNTKGYFVFKKDDEKFNEIKNSMGADFIEEDTIIKFPIDKIEIEGVMNFSFELTNKSSSSVQKIEILANQVSTYDKSGNELASSNYGNEVFDITFGKNIPQLMLGKSNTIFSKHSQYPAQFFNLIYNKGNFEGISVKEVGAPDKIRLIETSDHNLFVAEGWYIHQIDTIIPGADKTFVDFQWKNSNSAKKSSYRITVSEKEYKEITKNKDYKDIISQYTDNNLSNKQNGTESWTKEKVISANKSVDFSTVKNQEVSENELGIKIDEQPIIDSLTENVEELNSFEEEVKQEDDENSSKTPGLVLYDQNQDKISDNEEQTSEEHSKNNDQKPAETESKNQNDNKNIPQQSQSSAPNPDKPDKPEKPEKFSFQLSSIFYLLGVIAILCAIFTGIIALAGLGALLIATPTLSESMVNDHRKNKSLTKPKANKKSKAKNKNKNKDLNKDQTQNNEQQVDTENIQTNTNTNLPNYSELCEKLFYKDGLLSKPQLYPDYQNSLSKAINSNDEQVSEYDKKVEKLKTNLNERIDFLKDQKEEDFAVIVEELNEIMNNDLVELEGLNQQLLTRQEAMNKLTNGDIKPSELEQCLSTLEIKPEEMYQNQQLNIARNPFMLDKLKEKITTTNADLISNIKEKGNIITEKLNKYNEQIKEQINSKTLDTPIVENDGKEL